MLHYVARLCEDNVHDKPGKYVLLKGNTWQLIIIYCRCEASAIDNLERSVHINEQNRLRALQCLSIA